MGAVGGLATAKRSHLVCVSLGASAGCTVRRWLVVGVVAVVGVVVCNGVAGDGSVGGGAGISAAVVVVAICCAWML